MSAFILYCWYWISYTVYKSFHLIWIFFFFMGKTHISWIVGGNNELVSWHHS